MKDLTQGSIYRHILVVSGTISIGMLVQSLYFLVDLYFISQFGESALAGVTAAGNVSFLITALTQIISVGTVVLIAQACGSKDQRGITLIFSQSVLLSMFCGLLILAAGTLLIPIYMRVVASDGPAAEAGAAYLYWFMPGLALQFAFTTLGAVLRGTGVTRPTVLIQSLTVLINIVLAPILISGWGTGHPFGAAGAGLASTVAIVVGVALLLFCCTSSTRHFNYKYIWARLRPDVLKRLLIIGLPAGGELTCVFIFMAVIFAVTRDFGAATQAGFGIGARVMQAIFLPLMAISLAITPIAGQNFGAGIPERVRQTLYKAIFIEGVIMFMVTLLCQVHPEWLIRPFTDDKSVTAVGARFFQIVSWNFAAAGTVFACSGFFQALGNTWPSLISMFIRLATFIPIALWLARQTSFKIEQIWYLWVITLVLQAIISVLFARREMRDKLDCIQLA